MPSVEAKVLTLLALAGYVLSAGVLAAARRPGREPLGKLGVHLLAGGLGLSLAVLVLRVARGHLPTGNPFDTYNLLALLSGLVAIYLRAVHAIGRVSIALLPLAGAWSVLAIALSGAAYHDFARDVWAAAHVTLATASAVGFAAAAAGGWLYLRKHRQLRLKDPAVFQSKGPSLERLDRFVRHVLPVAFALVTATILTGLVGAFQPQREGYFHNWVTHPKMLTAGITWLLYTLALHAAHAKRFRGRTTAVLSLVGFVLLIGVLVASMLLPMG